MKFEEFTLEHAVDYLGKSIDAMVIADQSTDQYRSLTKKGIFKDIIKDNGSYTELVKKLWFHFNNSDKTITEEYQVFIPTLSRYVGKYSKRINMVIQETTHIIQMNIYPIENTEFYLLTLNELDESESLDENETQQKVSTIQNIYLFSMCFDLVRDTTSSLSLTEVSEDTMASQISYTDWRKMIVNMIWKDDQDTFMMRSDPEYLKNHFKPGQIDSFDCQMQNLDGVFIWVKLIFSRMDTTNENDYRFVYMVQNIHDTTVSMKATLKHYEELASRDPLTKIFNHGRIETELCNAIDKFRSDNTPAALMMLDIDFFKDVNDNYGHATGDTTLVRFAEIIKEFMSSYSAVFGRWGGEEFAVVVYGLGAEDLKSVSEGLRIQVEKENFEIVGKITCSIGASLVTSNDNFDSWFGRADKALYNAKTEGRNCVRIN